MENANIVKGFIELAQIDTISCLERKIVDAVKRKLTDIGCTVTEDDAASRIDGAGGFDANLLRRCGIELVGLATGYTANHTVKENLIVEDLIRAGAMVEKAALLYDQL